jgi:hypothetical protein
VGLLPDFGNFAPEIRYDALRRVVPYARHISAKTERFDAQGNHTAFDFDRCVRIAGDGGFAGVYIGEYWNADQMPVDYEWIADWMIDHIRANL